MTSPPGGSRSPLDENATYYWAARSSDGTASSPWSATIAFVVDTTNDPAAAPVLLRPADGSEVTTLVPELAVANSADPRGACAHVRVPDRQRPELRLAGAPGGSRARRRCERDELRRRRGWADNTEYQWRVAASDGETMSAWSVGSFFVNLANDAPEAPVPLAPADGEVVATASPTLRVQERRRPSTATR